MRISQITLNHIGIFENQTIDFPICLAEKAEIHIFTGVNGSGKSTLLKALLCPFDYTISSDRCIKNTNKFTKYLQFVDDEEKIKECEGKIIIEGLIKKSISKTREKGLVKVLETNKKEEIEFWGCRANGQEVHLHTPTSNNEIKTYRNLLNPEQKTRPTHRFSFALFAYSGYRFLDYSHETNPNFTNTAQNQNPLFQSLEFIKKPNPAYSLENWIMTSLLKRGYARDIGLENKIKSYEQTIDKLEKAISEIVGFELRFVLDSNLRYPNIKYDGRLHDFDTIPDGLKSIISWLADLCMRLEGLDWQNDTPIFERNIILFLDEIENHLHIKWQRKVLGVVQNLLPNAQIFISTHSPFISNSVDDAWIYKLEQNEKTKLTKVRKAIKSTTANSYLLEIMRIFDVEEDFGDATQQQLNDFYAQIEKIRNNETIDKVKFLDLAADLSQKSVALNNEIHIALNKLNKQTKKQYILW